MEPEESNARCTNDEGKGRYLKNSSLQALNTASTDLRHEPKSLCARNALRKSICLALVPYLFSRDCRHCHVALLDKVMKFSGSDRKRYKSSDVSIKPPLSA